MQSQFVFLPFKLLLGFFKLLLRLQVLLSILLSERVNELVRVEFGLPYFVISNVLVSLGFIKDCLFLSPEIGQQFRDLKVFLALYRRNLVQVPQTALLDLLHLSLQLSLSMLTLLYLEDQLSVVAYQLLNLLIFFFALFLHAALHFRLFKHDSFGELSLDIHSVLLQFLKIILVRMLQIVELAFQVCVLCTVVFSHLLVVALEFNGLCQLRFRGESVFRRANLFDQLSYFCIATPQRSRDRRKLAIAILTFLA